jgi:hypothetical protein
MLTELRTGKDQLPDDVLGVVASFLPVPPTKTKKAGRRKTRRAKTPVTL